MTRQSKFYIYSMGVVAADKEKDSWEIEVYPIELLPSFSGDLNPTIDMSLNQTGTDSSGGNISPTVDKNRLITCEWLNMFTANRVTPPDVMKGEKVLIWSYEGTDNYFWSSMFNDSDLRKHERVINVYKNTDTPGDFDPDDTYYHSIDTYEKLVKVHTPNSDGEYTTYDLEIDTARGFISFIDGKGNYINFDSTADHITINTKNKLTITTSNDVEVNTKNTTVNSSDTVVVNTKEATVNTEEANINSTNCTINNKQDVKVSTTNANVDASANVDVKAATVKVTAGAITLN